MSTNYVPYVVIGIFALLWGSTYFQMSPDKQFGGKPLLIGEPLGDSSWDFEDEPIAETPFDDPEWVVDNEVSFFQAQMSYNQEHAHSVDLKGTIHANLTEICGIAIDIVRDPYYQMEAREEIESKVRQTDSFMTTYMEETDGGDKDILESYHDIWEWLERIGVLAQKQSY